MTTSTKPPCRRSTERWENEGGPAHVPGLSMHDDLDPKLKRLEITPVQLTVFDWNGYRYSSAGDAIAAATRTSRIERPHFFSSSTRLSDAHGMNLPVQGANDA